MRMLQGPESWGTGLTSGAAPPPRPVELDEGPPRPRRALIAPDEGRRDGKEETMETKASEN